MRRIAACIGLLILSFATGGLAGPPTADSVTAHLTGGSERAWVKTRWQPVLAGSEGAPQCVGGEIWVFSNAGQGIRKTCENGTVQQREFKWAWVGVQDDQPVIRVDGKPYIAELRQRKAKAEGAPPVLVTILRTLRTSQAEPVEEITLEFQNF